MRPFKEVIYQTYLVYTMRNLLIGQAGLLSVGPLFLCLDMSRYIQEPIKVIMVCIAINSGIERKQVLHQRKVPLAELLAPGNEAKARETFDSYMSEEVETMFEVVHQEIFPV